jgi:hypothetical protein
MEPSTYTKSEINLLNKLDKFQEEMQNFDKLNYNDLIMFSSKINNKDLIINNSGMKDNLFRFNEKNKRVEKIDRSKVKENSYVIKHIFLLIFIYNYNIYILV